MYSSDAPQHTTYTRRAGVAHASDTAPLGDWTLSDDERELVSLVTRRVRLLTAAQAHSVCGQKSERCIKRLLDFGFLGSVVVLAHQEMALSGPLAVWFPGCSSPRFGALAYAAAVRWSQAPRATRVYFATARAAEVAGGHAGRPPRTAEATHDIHVSALYLLVRERRPDLAASWKPDFVILAERLRSTRRSRFKDKLPDAMVEHGERVTLMEFAGAYTAERVAAFHRYCARERVRYELW